MTATLETLRNVTTGTITTMLLKKGIRRSWMAGAMPFGFSGFASRSAVRARRSPSQAGWHTSGCACR